MKRFRFLGPVLLVAALCGACVTKTRQDNVTGSSATSEDHALSSWGNHQGTIHFAWRELASPSNTPSIRFRRVRMQGRGAETITVLDPQGGLAPQVDSDKSFVYVVWPKETGTSIETMLARSDNGGIGFASPQNLSNDATRTTAEVHVVANHTFGTSADTDNVYVVWSDMPTGGSNVVKRIQFRASNDAGVTFGPALTLSTDAQTDPRPRIAATENFVYVMWADTSKVIRFVVSDDKGATFSAPVDIDSATGTIFPARIATSGANVFVLWTAGTGGGDDVYFRQSTNNGSAFLAKVNVSPGSNRRARNPSMSYGIGAVHVAWSDQILPNGDTHVFFNTVDLATNGAGAAQNLSPGLSASTQAQIAASGSKVHMAWLGNHDVWWRYSADGGSTWRDAVALPDDAPDSAAEDRPRMIIRGSDAYVFWRKLPDIWLWRRWTPR